MAVLLSLGTRSSTVCLEGTQSDDSWRPSKFSLLGLMLCLNYLFICSVRNSSLQQATFITADFLGERRYLKVSFWIFGLLICRFKYQRKTAVHSTAEQMSVD